MNDATIPPDIRKAAEAVVERGYNEGLLDAVCRALMVERERCAKLAEPDDSYASVWIPGSDKHTMACALAEEIADRIRRGSS